MEFKIGGQMLLLRIISIAASMFRTESDSETTQSQENQ